jgi:hypothetical protein
MAGGRSKVVLQVVMPPELKAEVDAAATAEGLDRSAWICARLQAPPEASVVDDLARRLDQVLRDHDVLREQLGQVITLIETFMAAVGKPQAPAEKGYPQPATWQETYPELYQPATPDAGASGETPTPQTKRWGLWPR